MSISLSTQWEYKHRIVLNPHNVDVNINIDKFSMIVLYTYHHLKPIVLNT